MAWNSPEPATHCLTRVASGAAAGPLRDRLDVHLRNEDGSLRPSKALLVGLATWPELRCIEEALARPQALSGIAAHLFTSGSVCALAHTPTRSHPRARAHPQAHASPAHLHPPPSHIHTHLQHCLAPPASHPTPLISHLPPPPLNAHCSALTPRRASHYLRHLQPPMLRRSVLTHGAGGVQDSKRTVRNAFPTRSPSSPHRSTAQWGPASAKTRAHSSSRDGACATVRREELYPLLAVRRSSSACLCP